MPVAIRRDLSEVYQNYVMRMGNYRPSMWQGGSESEEVYLLWGFATFVLKWRAERVG